MGKSMEDIVVKSRKIMGKVMGKIPNPQKSP
jgi:hypothetical protein